jgi:L,D-peptidoglycan transpeptidase YkuD (ErfK/YbiS/YcfS/YnhG family)
LLPVPHGENGIPSKRERDTRSPAGCFQLGTLYGYAPQAPANVSLPYYQVTARDCWIDDSASPQYNQHVAVDLTAPPAWYEQQKMRLGDFAYEWMLEIQHNTAPAKSQAGSAIFFHIRRGADKPTHGCTSMEKTSLVSLLGWLQPMAQPLYVLLPITEYQHRIKSWALPALPE